jgi:hypothetical protein
MPQIPQILIRQRIMACAVSGICIVFLQKKKSVTSA